MEGSRSCLAVMFAGLAMVDLIGRVPGLKKWVTAAA